MMLAVALRAFHHIRRVESAMKPEATLDVSLHVGMATEACVGKVVCLLTVAFTARRAAE